MSLWSLGSVVLSLTLLEGKEWINCRRSTAYNDVVTFYEGSAITHSGVM